MFELNGRLSYGIIEGDDIFTLEGTPFEARKGARAAALTEVRLRPPVMPSKIVCVGRNYAAHAQERGVDVPTEPMIFMKPPTALSGDGDAIELLPETGRVEHEAELAIVIGRQGRYIAETDALRYVLGYACANDVSDRDFQKKDGQFTRAKGFDTFCPLGPWIETDLNPSALAVRCSVNGELKQDGTTADMIFKPAYLISFVSRVMTLLPGDVLLTGTPSGTSPLTKGDTVEVEIEGIGKIANPVKAVNPTES
jgi:2-keto-4-pentenoate hydratase/2-oxohepta-3-ene-1,7-dioic acid hydratase in catechol pathway